MSVTVGLRGGGNRYLSSSIVTNSNGGFTIAFRVPAKAAQGIYTYTNNHGRWAMTFSIPRHSVSRHSNQAYLTVQLWHGHSTVQSFKRFTLI